jgi:thiol-disulfide isomerase/thioredoxin
VTIVAAPVAAARRRVIIRLSILFLGALGCVSTMGAAIGRADSTRFIPWTDAAAPALALNDLGGAPRTLGDYRGRILLVNFWATWCEPCRREIPLLNTLQGEHRSEGLAVVGIAVDTRRSVVDFLKATPLHYTVLVGEEDGAEAAEKFGMELGLPFTVFADSRNRIVAIKLGELHRDEADAILAQMRNLEAGKITLESARSAISEALRTLGIERSKQSPST